MVLVRWKYENWTKSQKINKPISTFGWLPHFSTRSSLSFASYISASRYCIRFLLLFDSLLLIEWTRLRQVKQSILQFLSSYFFVFVSNPYAFCIFIFSFLRVYFSLLFVRIFILFGVWLYWDALFLYYFCHIWLVMWEKKFTHI